MSSRWPGSLINKTAPTSSGGGAQDSAPGVWTLDQANPYIATQTWPGTGTPDPQFQYVTALLHGDGTNGGQNNTFLDSSSNNFTITRNGNTTQGSFSPYGSLWSNYFNGSSNLYLGGQSNFAFGTGDWTVSFWLNLNTVSGNQTIFDTRPSGTGDSSNYMVLQSSGGSLNYYTSGSGTSIDGADLVAGTWYWVELSKVSGNTRLFVNGSQSGSTYSDSQNYVVGSNRPIIANDGYQSNTPVNGYISNFRMVKGSGITSSTVPTTPLTAITNTVLLTAQSNRFIDNSSNNYTINIGGSPSVQRFSPFQNLATYQTAKIGGSGYFDGSGDYLTLTNSGAFDANTSFTFECWFYSLGTGTYVVFGVGGGTADWNTSTGSMFQMVTNASGSIFWQWNNSGSPIAITGTTPSINAWHHVAVGYNGTTTRFWLDGVSVGTSTTGYTLPTTRNKVDIGAGAPNDNPNYGYVSGLRFIRGTDVYGVGNSTITVPTTPPTAITNTSLLTNFTNGSIYDNAAMNDLETVGNAQISTSVYKYGTGSMAFDGTGDYLFAPASNLYALGGGNFTIEMWIYPSNVSTSEMWLVAQTNYAANTGWSVFMNNNTIKFRLGNTGGTIQSSALLTANTWQHIALVRLGTTLTMYLNGTSFGSGTVNNFTDASLMFVVGGITATTGWNNTLPYTGYIDDLRITKGYARYWFNFQPPAAPYPNYGGTLQLTYDPYFENTTLLLNGEGTNGAQNNTFLDSSTNNFTITRNGNTTQGSFSPYGSLWSNYFPGSSSFSGGTSLSLGTGDFTVEFWVNIYTYSPVNVPITIGDSVGSSGIEFLINSSGNIRIYGNNAYYNNITSATVPLNTWTHIAFVRSSGSVTTYLNGQSVNTTTISASISGSPYVGAERYSGSSTNYMYGYISNMRVTTNAVYTANFTPSTTPLTAVTGTVFLTCQGNRFIDASTNNATITISGTPSVQRFSPFNPTSTYSTSVIGGSGYFDGSGDYLAAPNNTAFNFNADYTIEAWVNYNATITSAQTILSNYTGSAGTASGFALYPKSVSGTLAFRYFINNGEQIVGTTAPKPGTWYHVAVCRSGSSTKMFVNGVQEGSTYTDSSSFTSTATLKIGSTDGASEYMNGYISDARIIKGTALYTTTFTPPTAPLTAVTNTSLLTNFTNAGIPDLAMMNDLETVGNAQISTSVKKYGTGSLAFDGTGDYLVAANKPTLPLGGGSWTVELWLYANSVSTFQTVAVFNDGSGNDTNYSWQVAIMADARIRLYCPSDGNTNVYQTYGPHTISTGQWYYIAATYDGTNYRVFINGNPGTSVTGNAMNTIPNGRLGIGADTYNAGSNNLNGYIDDLRITKGLARYVQNFTPPTAALPTY